MLNQRVHLARQSPTNLILLFWNNKLLDALLLLLLPSQAKLENLETLGPGEMSSSCFIQFRLAFKEKIFKRRINLRVPLKHSIKLILKLLKIQLHLLKNKQTKHHHKLFWIWPSVSHP